MHSKVATYALCNRPVASAWCQGDLSGGGVGNLLIKAFTSMLNRKARSKYLKGRSGLPHAQILGKDCLGEAAQEFGRKFVLLSSLLAF